MTQAQLPRQINVLHGVEQGLYLAGSVPIKKMPRLVASLANNQGEATIDWRFGKDEEGLGYIKGHLRSKVQLVFQRCLQPMEYLIDDEVHLSPVFSEAQAKSLPSHYEPVLIETDSQAFLPLIEDELILRLPMIALHDTETCHAPSAANKVTEVNSDNPFAKELSKLK